MSRKEAASGNAELLIEIGCEDLPARFVRPLAEALASGVGSGLHKRHLASGSVRIFATPRRLAVAVAGVPLQQADQQVERKGPKLAAAIKDGAPTQAGLGFAKSCGVAFEKLEQEDGQLVFRSVQRGRTTADLLQEVFDEALKEMDALVPKRMRWGSGEETFVRPVQWLACLLGGKAIPLRRFGLKAGNRTLGHRFHAPKAIVLKSPAEYEKKLKAAKVWADFESRRAEIRRQVESEAKKLKGAARITQSLLDEVTALVEWPVAIHGGMEKRFMQLPAEVIVATIETNQKYFPVFGAKGRLLPHFITVSNIASKNARLVVEGNERVVRPRLSDALFFWDQDRRKSLIDHATELGRVTFQKDLGTIAQKASRIAKLAKHIATRVEVDADVVERAASLCKADLVTRMVFEFPELQGVMGGYYAGSAGESKDVAIAIHEHYQPVVAGGPIPSTRPGQVVALADKLDTLAGIFSIGQKPTASKDPFALRRAALGTLRICIEGKLPVDLREVLAAAIDLQPVASRDVAAAMDQPGQARARQDALLTDLEGFILERLRAYYEGLPPEMYEAVRALGISAPLDFDARVQALRGFWKLPAAKNLAAAHKRIRNILRQAGEGDIEIRPDHFREAQERDLYDALQRLDDGVHAAVARADYTGALKSLAGLQAPVDAFFDKVMVIAPEEELRANRVAMLRRLDRLCRSVADISCLPG